MKKIKDKYIDIVKSRVDTCQLVVSLCPEVVLRPAGPHRKKCCCVFHQGKTPSLILDWPWTVTSALDAVKVATYCHSLRSAKDLALPIPLAIYSTCTVLILTVRMFLSNVHLKRKTTTEKWRQCIPTTNREFFRSQYEANSIKSKACRSYTELSEDKSTGRWDATFCSTFGLGYSPLRGNHFVQFAKRKGLKFEILLQLGLIGEDETPPDVIMISTEAVWWYPSASRNER